MNKFKRLFAPVDMTVGRPWEDILIFTIPMLIGNIAQQLYNTVDSIVVGRYVGDNALAAVGSAGPILNLLIVLFVGISVGASIMVSQYLGAKNREALSGTIGTCIVLTAIASLIIMVVATMAARPLLELLNTPESILDWCTSYLRILFLGAAGLAFYNILSGVLRGLGDSMSALLYLLVASALNIVLDLLFVIKFNMGVSGVALATALAQGISALLCVRRLSKLTELFDLKWKYIRLNKHHAGNIIRLGVPSGVTQAMISMAMLIVQSLTNSFGEQFIAVGTSAVVTGLILLFGKPLMGIFTTTSELVDLSYYLMQILAVGYLVMSVIQVLSGIMRGAGDTMTPMWISIVQTIAIRVPLAYILVYVSRSAAFPQGKREYIYLSLVISWIIGALITILFYKRGKWKTKAIK